MSSPIRGSDRAGHRKHTCQSWDQTGTSPARTQFETSAPESLLFKFCRQAGSQQWPLWGCPCPRPLFEHPSAGAAGLRQCWWGQLLQIPTASEPRFGSHTGQVWWPCSCSPPCAPISIWQHVPRLAWFSVEFWQTIVTRPALLLFGCYQTVTLPTEAIVPACLVTHDLPLAHLPLGSNPILLLPHMHLPLCTLRILFTGVY